MRILCFLLLITLLSFTGSKHPMHISVSSIEENSKEEIYEITFKIFTDDLEAAIFEDFKEKVKIKVNQQIIPESGKDLLAKYIAQHFYWSLNGKKQTVEYVGFESNNEATWIYLQTHSKPVSGKIEIRNTILFDIHEDQSNITHFKSGAGKKSLMFNSSSPVQEISI